MIRYFDVTRLVATEEPAVLAAASRAGVTGARSVRGAVLAQCALTAVISVGFLPDAVLAQSPPAASDGSEALQEIVVTGQKRVEHVQDVPKTVTVEDQAQLTNAGVTRLTDLQSVVPTITATSQYQNTQNPGIRGIAPIANSVGVQSQTGVIVDDVPQSTFSTLAFNLTDVDRVEVFAGPQTTLSGRNAAAGLINIVTRSPSNTPEAEFTVDQTTDTQTRATAFLTGPIDDTLAYSLSILYNKWGGDLHNALLGNDRIEGFDTKGSRFKLQWKPVDDLTALFTAYYIENTTVAAPFLAGQNFTGGSANDSLIFDALTPPRTVAQLYPGIHIGRSNTEVYSTVNGYADSRDLGGTLRLDYDVGAAGTLSSLSSYTYSSQPRLDQEIGTPRTDLVFPITDFAATTNVQSKYLTEEIRLTSSSTGPFTYLAGFMFARTDLKQPYDRPELFAVDWDRAFNIRSSALFARGSYDFTAADSITVGLRYQYDRLAYSWRFIPIAATDPNTESAGDNGYGFVGGEMSYKHKFTDTINAYLTYSESQTGKAYDLEDNATAAVGTLQPLASERVHNWELGVKNELLDRRLTVNADVFWAEYRNYQIQSIEFGTLTSVPVTRLAAIGSVRSRGADLDVSMRVTPDFRFSLVGALADSQIESFPGASCYSHQTAAEGCGATGIQAGNLSGLSLPFAPKWKGTADADYTWHVASLKVDAGAFYRYQSQEHFDVLGDPLTYQGGFGTMNVYSGVTGSDSRWNVQVYVNNLFNHLYYSSISDSTFFVPTPVVSGQYDRSSFRYGGIRASVRF